MKKSKFTESQVVHTLKAAEAEVPVDELLRKYGGLEGAEMKRFRDLEAESRRCKGLVADLSLDKQILQEVLLKRE